MSIVLSRTRPWLDADSIDSTATESTTAPSSNLKSTSLALNYRDTSSSSFNGVEWDYNNVEVSAWAFAMLGINTATAAAGTDFIVRLDNVSPYVAATVLNTATDEYDPATQYGITGSVDVDRLDVNLFLGIDALTTGPAVTGAPAATAHKSGTFLWSHTLAAHPDGYHEALALLVGVDPLVFPQPTSFGYRSVELRRGYGWEVTITWQYLEERPTSGAGGVDLDNLISAERDRPILACLDTRGMDGDGLPNAAKASRWRRLGACRIVGESEADFFAPKGSDNFGRQITLRTWEEEPIETP